MSNESQFWVGFDYLDDNSEVFNVMFGDGTDDVVLWNAPSQTSAELLQVAMQRLLNSFKNCGCDRQLITLSNMVLDAIHALD